MGHYYNELMYPDPIPSAKPFTKRPPKRAKNKAMNHNITDHEVRIITWLNEREGKWEIRVCGVTSGAEIHGGDGDSMSIRFELDASRFQPVIKQGKLI